MNKKDLQSGQIGLILLVVLGLLITLIMSLASRTLSDSVLSRQDKEQSATFAIAESGVEEALRSIKSGVLPTGASQVSDSLSQIIGQYTIASRNGLEIFLKEGEVAEINMAGAATPNLTFSWTKKGTPSENLACTSEGSAKAPAALEITAIAAGSYTVSRQYYNAFGCVLASNGFSQAGAGDAQYLSSINWPVIAGTTFVRVRPLYSGATVKVAGVALPAQQYDIQSQAKGGDAEKEIQVNRSLDNPPSIFDYALFSGEKIVK